MSTTQVGFYITVAYSNLLPRFALCNLCFSNFSFDFSKYKTKTRTLYLLLTFFGDSDAI